MGFLRQIPLLLSVFAMASASAAGPGLSSLSWLSGCWASEGGEPGSGEQWSAPAGGTMLGMGRTVKDGKTAQFEFMELRHLPDGTLAFIAHPSGQRTTTFPVLRISGSEVVFENLQHDFPQRVAYAREGDHRLRARIEGMRGETLRVVEFPMDRVACRGGAGRPG
ncbi:DUF6265 family protein [Luteimonas changyuni]|uniref:DUF6265 family protein n=1 Tax=Luteimonas sp. MJ145 TaxID=3129234 RepID=UPI0031B9DBE5